MKWPWTRPQPSVRREPLEVLELEARIQALAENHLKDTYERILARWEVAERAAIARRTVARLTLVAHLAPAVAPIQVKPLKWAKR